MELSVYESESDEEVYYPTLDLENQLWLQAVRIKAVIVCVIHFSKIITCLRDLIHKKSALRYPYHELLQFLR